MCTLGEEESGPELTGARSPLIQTCSYQTQTGLYIRTETGAHILVMLARKYSYLADPGCKNRMRLKATPRNTFAQHVLGTVELEGG